MNPQQTTQTQQSHHTPPVLGPQYAPLEMTPQEIVHVFGELNRLLSTLQNALGVGQNELPTIDIEG
jgi:hypothetical protein